LESGLAKGPKKKSPLKQSGPLKNLI